MSKYYGNDLNLTGKFICVNIFDLIIGTILYYIIPFPNKFKLNIFLFLIYLYSIIMRKQFVTISILFELRKMNNY